jgi:hypothetical protein
MVARSYGILLLALGVGACTAPSRGGENKTGTQSAALNGEVTQHLAWGSDIGQIGFRPSFREALPAGAPAVAVGPGGQVYVLDALNGRVVKATKGDLVPVAGVPSDSDDLAIGADGAIAVHRGVKPEVLVFTPRGETIGAVDVSAVEQVDGIALGTSRRVIVTNAFQETFLVGSPSVPQLRTAILANKREGAAMLDSATGVTAVKRDDGELELRVVAAGADRTATIATHALGKGDAARVIGAGRGAACLRIEHVTQDGQGPLSVEREAVCLDVQTGATLFHTKLPAPGAYLPRRELAFAGSTLAFAHADADGLTVTTWTIPDVAGGVR